MEQKIGAEKMELSVMEPVKKHKHTGEFKVKTEKFKVWFDLV